MSDQAPSYDSWAMTCSRAPSSPSSSRPDPTPQVNLPAALETPATSFSASNWVFGETRMRNPVPDMFKCFWDSDSDEDWELESVLEPKILTAAELERNDKANEYWDMDMKDWHDEIFFNWADEPRLSVRAAARPSINPRAPAFVPSLSPSPTGSPINPQAPEFIPSRPASPAINPQAPEFIPSRSASPMGTAINPQAPEFIPSRTGSPTSNPINPLAMPFFPSPPAEFSGPPHAINHVHPTFTTTGTNWRSALAPPPPGAARPAPALRAYIRNPPFSFHNDPRVDSSGRLRSSRRPTRESVRALNESWGRALAVNEAAAVARAAEMIGTQAAEDDADAAVMVDVDAEADNAGAADMQTGGGAFALPPPEQMVWRFNRAGPLGEVLREAEPREVAQRAVITYRDVQAYLERRAYVAQQERPDRWFNAASRAEMRGWIQEVRVERERQSVGKKRKITDEER